jgi:hypothetical protein
MGSDDNDRVLLLIEENRLHTSRHLAYLRTILQIVSETHCSRLPSEKEQ